VGNLVIICSLGLRLLAALTNALAPLGHIVAIGGSSASIRLEAKAAGAGEPTRITIGNFLGIETDASCVVAVITNVDGTDRPPAHPPEACRLGPTFWARSARAPRAPSSFSVPITRYPMLGDAARLLRGDNLRMVFDSSGAAVSKIGKLQQHTSIEATVNVDDLLGKHAALLGSTGFGNKRSGTLRRGATVALSRTGRRAIRPGRHRRRRSHAPVEATMQKKLPGSAANAMMEIVDPAEARKIIRAGDYAGHTAGVAPQYVQGNLCILPQELALEFAAFCQRNPKPCPIIGMGAPGDPTLPDLGDIDIRTDVPRYRVFKDGKQIDEPLDIRKYWTQDLVTFVLGCSFSFELPILQAGIALRHIEDDTTVPMYRTSIDCVPAGRFRGKMVVSMRPFTPADAIRVIQITSRFPAVHGAPVHIAMPEAIGVRDIMRPDFGDPPAMRAGELPLFWGCGVTPQVAIEAARPSLCITHKPGAMLITDKRNSALAAI